MWDAPPNLHFQLFRHYYTEISITSIIICHPFSFYLFLFVSFPFFYLSLLFLLLISNRQKYRLYVFFCLFSYYYLFILDLIAFSSFLSFVPFCPFLPFSIPPSHFSSPLYSSPFFDKYYNWNMSWIISKYYCDKNFNFFYVQCIVSQIRFFLLLLLIKV